MSSIRSKVYFIVLTALLVGGFPNFMAQEAHAAAAVVSVITNTSTQITITFSENITTEGGVNLPADWTVGGVVPQAVTDESGGGTTTLVLTMSAANAFATDALPTVIYTDPGDNTVIESGVDAADIVVNQAATDGAPATFVSAATTNDTTIDITFSEDIVDTASDLADYVINGVAGGSDISAKAVNGAVLTLTTNGYSILSTDNPTITVTLTANELEDTGTNNDTVTFGPSAVTNNTDVISTGGGDSDGKFKTKPTFGVDHKTSFQLIEDGFSFNGVPTDITHNYWTPYEQQNIKLGELNEFETKVFASEKLRVQEFLFGIPVVGEAYKAELGVEVHYDHSGEIEEITVIQKTDVIDIDSVQIEKINSKCRADSSDELCVTTQLQMKFLEPLQNNVMAMKAIDFKGRSQITYLNDGFDISGDSLNPMKTMMIIGTEKYEGLIKVTQIAKYSDVWVAKDGRAFEMNEYNTPKLINQLIQDKIDTRNNLDRYNLDFVDYRELQAQKAIEQLLEICPTCLDSFTDFDDSFGHEYSNELNALDNPEIIQKMILENERAQKIMNYLIHYTNKKLKNPVFR